MAATAPSTFERYALYLLAVLIIVLFAWGITRTLGSPSAEHTAITAPLAKLVAVDAPARPAAILIDYRLADTPVEELAVPNLSHPTIPQDLRSLSAISERKLVFIKLMMPLVLRANEVVAEKRRRLLEIEGRQIAGLTPSESDKLWLAAVAEEYGVKRVDIGLLKLHVDLVPPSLALAQAAEESGWGTSRFAVEGNALFGQRVYHGDGGMVPLRREAGKRHRVRAFDNLQESVSRYAHNLNTHWAYLRFRQMRASMRSEGLVLDGRELIAALDRYSERGPEYIETIRSIISYNGLTAFDRVDRNRGEQLISTPGA